MQTARPASYHSCHVPPFFSDVLWLEDCPFVGSYINHYGRRADLFTHEFADEMWARLIQHFNAIMLICSYWADRARVGTVRKSYLCCPNSDEFIRDNRIHALLAWQEQLQLFICGDQCDVCLLLNVEYTIIRNDLFILLYAIIWLRESVVNVMQALGYICFSPFEWEISYHTHHLIRAHLEHN